MEMMSPSQATATVSFSDITIPAIVEDRELEILIIAKTKK